MIATKHFYLAGAYAEKPVKRVGMFQAQISMKRFLTYGMIAGVLSFASCKESETIYIYPPSPMNNAEDFVNRFGPPKQQISMNTSELPKTITLLNGTKITVPQTSIQKNGNYVSGKITLEAYEMLKRSDIILGGINTNHYDGSPVNSKGIVSVNIVAGGHVVDQTLTNLMNISIPSAQGGFMRISRGNPNANATGFMAWGPEMVDSINSDGSSYSFNTLKMGWINCGVFYMHDIATGSLTVSLTNNPGEIATSGGVSGNTFVYFCPKGANVAMQCSVPSESGVVIVNDNKMPVGIQGKLIAFSIKDRKFYYGERAFTTSQINQINVELSEIPSDDLILKIRELDSY